MTIIALPTRRDTEAVTAGSELCLQPELQVLHGVFKAYAFIAEPGSLCRCRRMCICERVFPECIAPKHLLPTTPKMPLKPPWSVAPMSSPVREQDFFSK